MVHYSCVSFSAGFKECSVNKVFLGRLITRGSELNQHGKHTQCIVTQYLLRLQLCFCSMHMCKFMYRVIFLGNFVILSVAIGDANSTSTNFPMTDGSFWWRQCFSKAATRKLCLYHLVWPEPKPFLVNSLALQHLGH